MARSKQKGQIAETAVLADAVRRGYQVSIPFSEDCRYDLVVDRHGSLDRVQCKYTASSGHIIEARGRCTNNWSTTMYTSDDIEWLAVYDATTERCYYIPSRELGDSGHAVLHLRLTEPRNGQQRGIRWASDYTEW